MTPKERENAIEAINKEMGISDLVYTNVCPRCKHKNISIQIFGGDYTSYERYECLSWCWELTYDEDEMIHDMMSISVETEYENVMLDRLLIRLGKRESAMWWRYHEYYYAHWMIMKANNWAAESVCKWLLWLSADEQPDETLLFLLSLIDQWRNT